MNTLRARIACRAGGLRTALLCGAALGGFAAMPSAAFAQDAEDAAQDGNDFGERVIVVQARRQNETLQEVPVTVTAIGGETLERYSIDQVADIASRVPTLNVQVGGSGSGGQLSLRGVGSSNISAAFDSAVAFEYDGVVVSTMRMVQAGFFDVEQVDVLRGPQSLFFGKSATAGVLSLRSANPTPNWEVGVRGSYEFEEKGYLVSGYISGPLSDTLGMRLAAQYNDIDEFQLLQPGTPAVNQKRGLKDLIVRGTLEWEPSDRFSANLKVQYTRNENDGAIGTAEIGCGPNGLPDPVFLLGGGVVIPGGHDCNVQDQRYFIPDAAPQLAPGVPTPSAAAGRNGVPFGKTDIWFGRLQFELDLSDTLSLTSVTGLLNMDAVDFDCYSYVGVFPGGIPGGAGCSDPINSLEQYSQELRLASDFDGAFNFMLGAFYEDRTFIFDTAQQGVNISFLGADPITGFTYDWDKTHTTKTEALSFFGSAMIDLTDKLELSGGVRWTDETKVQTISVPYIHLFLQGPGFVQPGFFSGPINFKDDNFSPEVTLRYQANDDLNFFASYKTGFKSGGIDNSALPSNSLSQAAISGDFSSLIFQSEEAEGGEIGFKSQWAGRSFTLNATAYYYVFTDLQVQNFNATTIQFVTSNAGELTTKGVDIESRWITPVDGLNLSANLSYLDAQYTDTFLQPGGAGGTIDLDGRRGSQAPEWAGNIAFDWTVPVNDNLEFFMSGNAAYNDGYITDEATLNDYVQPSFWTLDGTISVGAPDGKWKLSLIGVNLTDEIFVITSGGRPFLAPPGNIAGLPAGDDLVLTQNRGRQVFVEASFKF
ncbi:TonB-dependent receptor [Erythrobacter sp. sf7]|uniref:TonB-dependent receptor n=1 Tax=Erythrobacter fulvus TaxID=2987523 RepID=A0ABT5JME5_9SPHN|nr:TonB-dependent receptor [Erythrobacter fulvus]MDC8753916.1 TonB-dependent receptor [Erythrobacter fulvus]